MDSESNVVVVDAHGTININEIIHKDINSQQLSSVLDNLTVDECKSVFFLLMDHIEEGEDFLSITKEEIPYMKDKLNQILKTINGDSILIELLATMKQFKTLKTFGVCHHVYEALQESKFNNIDRVLKMFYSLCEELTDDDLKKLKRIFPDIQDQIKTAEDWFYWALRDNFISRDDFSKLEILFKYYTNCLDIIKNYVKFRTYSIRKSSKNIHCGIAAIFNYDFFHDKFTQRKWSNIDVDSLKDVFYKFGFKTDIHNNLTERETVAKLRHYAAIDHSNYDVFACVFLSHGLSNTIISSDGKEMQIPFLISQITNKCSSLNLKPKLFFIQACQGTNIQQGFGNPVYELKPGEKVTYPPIHPIATDVLLAVSSINGFVSFRSEDKGSWFINALCKVMKQKGHKLSMLDVMIEVNNLVRLKHFDFGQEGLRNSQQIVNCINTFAKVLILKQRTDE